MNFLEDTRKYLENIFWRQRTYNTYNNLKGIINNKYFVLLKGDKDSNMFTIHKSDYVSKVHKMIDESINKGV